LNIFPAIHQTLSPIVLTGKAGMYFILILRDLIGTGKKQEFISGILILVRTRARKGLRGNGPEMIPNAIKNPCLAKCPSGRVGLTKRLCVAINI
jgi:hypothetical protein